MSMRRAVYPEQLLTDRQQVSVCMSDAWRVSGFKRVILPINVRL